MNENNELIKIYRCNICYKNYSSQSSLCNHNKKYHTNKSSTISIPSISVSVPVSVQNIFQCKYCNKIYANRHSKWKHQNMCKYKIDNNNNKINIPIEKQLEEFKNTILEIIQKETKNYPKILNTINNQLISNTNSQLDIQIQKLKHHDISTVQLINNNNIKFNIKKYKQRYYINNIVN